MKQENLTSVTRPLRSGIIPFQRSGSKLGGADPDEASEGAEGAEAEEEEGEEERGAPELDEKSRRVGAVAVVSAARLCVDASFNVCTREGSMAPIVATLLLCEAPPLANAAAVVLTAQRRDAMAGDQDIALYCKAVHTEEA